MTTPEPLSSSDATARRHAQFDAFAAFAVAGALTLFAGLLAKAVPLVAANIGLVVAAIFILVPGWFLHRRGERDTAYGLAFHDVAVGLRWGLLATVVTFVLFVPAFHLWSTKVEHRVASFAWSHYLRPSDTYFGEPANALDGNVHVWTWGNVIHVTWLPHEGPWELRIDADARSSGVAGASVYASPIQLSDGEPVSHVVRTGVAVQPVSLTLFPHEASRLRLSAVEGGRDVPASRILRGSGERPMNAHDTTAEVPLNLWWLLSLVLSQLILVALPEEFFYRGFLQEKLKQAGWQRTWHIGPLPLSTATMLASALFAVGHLFIGFGAHRLAVFFPSLVFGSLREKTQGIVASTIYHACCNLMVYLCGVHYF